MNETNENPSLNQTTPVVETKPVVASVAKKSSGKRGRPALVCNFLDKYMQKQYTRLSLEDVQCAADSMAKWVLVKKGELSAESVKYVKPPKVAKVAKTKVVANAVADTVSPVVS